MKKVICSKVQTLDPSDLELVVGGKGIDPKTKELSDKLNGKICEALNPGKGSKVNDRSICDGCAAGASELHEASDKESQTKAKVNDSKNRHGCNSRASSSSNSGGSGSSRVICTYFYKKGMLERDVWRADLEFTERYLSKITVKGYHYWAIPYVELMRKRSFFEKIMLPIAKYRAYELAYKMKMREKGSLIGKLIRLTFEPTCYLIGLFCEQKDWSKLWVNQ
ncbi:hypothetical protein [Vibrio sp. SCSIO 43137]|uniref:hypothetical protein n=1 Tax=Vibrio sp. SCSIO 43137 TaxID=3021011 RepID=UPI002307DC9F|nr:hypothetical protein [Vibrio sp. SCSIO 43137]WCE30496.1 hypothetical protein PK654_04250 [Vibrio sp. SCSIO 43137]